MGGGYWQGAVGVSDFSGAESIVHRGCFGIFRRRYEMFCRPVTIKYSVMVNQETKKSKWTGFTGLTGYEPILYILLILSKELIESKKNTSINIYDYTLLYVTKPQRAQSTQRRQVIISDI